VQFFRSEKGRGRPEEENDIVGILLPYLKSLHYFGFNVPIYVQDNPFGVIKHVTKDDTKYITLFEKCFKMFNVSFYKNSLTC
jgi:hypothetical protein